MSKNLFENITDDEFAALEWVLTNEGSNAGDYFFDDPTVDGRIQELEKYGMVKTDIHGSLSITELGRAALKEHDRLVERRERFEHQRKEELSSLKTMAEAACTNAVTAVEQVTLLKEQVGLLKSQTESSNQEAKFSKIIAIISTIIAVGGLAVAIIALFT